MDIELKDSSFIINKQLLSMLELVREKVNRKIIKGGDGVKLSDTDREFLFVKTLYDTFLQESLIWTPFEFCIDTNRCKGWDFVERIIANRSENIYSQSGYSRIAGKHSTSVINLCGVRMGADKLTHMFLDGYLYYNCSQDKQANLSDAEIRKGSAAVENSLMGLSLTGVHSKADVEANIMGVKFYRDLFSKTNSLLKKNSDGLLSWRKEVNICNYITKNFDETYNKNEYIKKPRLIGNNEIHKVAHELQLKIWKDKLRKLDEMINIRIQEANFRTNCWTKKDRDFLKLNILARMPERPSVSKLDILIHGTKGVLDWMFYSEVRKGYSPYIFKCLNRKNRKETQLAE